MEIARLISALEQTISFLKKSQPSGWANMSVDEIIQELQSIINTIRDSGAVDSQQLGFLFAPTAAIQETAIDNGWGDDFLRISDIVDDYMEHR